MVEANLAHAVHTHAENLLRAQGATSVRLGPAVPVGDARYRSSIYRCRVVEGPPAIGPSIVVKRAIGTMEESDQNIVAARGRFQREVQALLFLTGIPNLNLAPHLHAWDGESLTMVMEDLGDVHSLADLLTGSDPAAATSALLLYARSLGLIHAASADREAEYELAGEAAGADSSPVKRTSLADLGQNITEACRRFDLEVAAGWNDTFEWLDSEILTAPRCRTFVISDVCPDNHALHGNGIRFFDFEMASFGHPFLDAAYLCLPFPTCWCMGTLPSQLQAQALESYRDAIRPVLPDLAKDATFAEEMLHACCFWTIRSVGWTILDDLNQPQEWGLVDTRRRTVYRLDLLARMARRNRRTKAIAETVGPLARRLTELWRLPEPVMPLYPAFTSVSAASESRV